MKLQLNNVSLIYDKGGPGETVGLPPITLTLQAAKPLVLTGSNGCGKTTLLKILAGLLPPSAGEILRDDSTKPINCDWLRTNTAFLRQQPAAGVFSDLTLAENLALFISDSGWFAPYFPGIPFARSETELAKLVPFYADLKNRRFSELSGGQQQLFAVGCVGSDNRTMILFDEPTSALDPVARVKTEVLLRTVCQRPELISVIVTHDANLASRLDFESKTIDEIASRK